MNKTNTQNDTTFSGTYYCSGRNAQSTEDGSMNNPFKTLEKAIRTIPGGSTLLLERGYEYPFFSEIAFRVISLGAYGEGAKPVVSRFIKIKNVNKNLFTRDDPKFHIWTLNFDRLVELSGHSADDLKNIGFIYNPQTDEIVFGEKVAFKNAVDMYVAFNYTAPSQSQLHAFTCLNKDGSFFQSSDGRTIKMVYNHDPNDLTDLWFATDGQFLNSPHDCTIQDIKITGYAANAIFMNQDNVTVKNVEFDLIGGRAFDMAKVETTSFRRDGNGIELWKTSKNTTPLSNIEILNCSFNRIFSGAIALGGSVYRNLGIPGADNILIHDCNIDHCRYAITTAMAYIEDNGSQTGGARVNVRFYNNASRNAGDNQFGSPFFSDAHLYSGLPGFVIANNDFYNGNFQYRYTYDFGYEMQQGNVCHIAPGQNLITIRTYKTSEVMYPYDPTEESVAEAVAEYRELADDKYTVFECID